MRAVRDDPQGTGLERIRRELVAALSAITSVRNIDSFGSVATGCADQWSDLDLLISCEVPEHTAWLAAGVIRSTKRVAFYRMFTGVAQPSGRYWFCNESPFHRLDVTFHSPAEHAAVCRSGVRAGHPIHVRSEYMAHVPADLSADRRLTSPAGRADVTPCETEIGRLLYRHLEAAKTQLHGRLAKRDVLETRAALLDAAAETPILAGGGDLVGFVASVDEFIQRRDMTHCKTDDQVTSESKLLLSHGQTFRNPVR
jgi:hypothetical protein